VQAVSRRLVSETPIPSKRDMAFRFSFLG